MESKGKRVWDEVQKLTIFIGLKVYFHKNALIISYFELNIPVTQLSVLKNALLQQISIAQKAQT